LSEHLGKQFFVENVPGATGNIGTSQAAKAAPDGYTVLGAFSSYVVNPTLFDKIPYDPYKDFDPVTLATTSTTVLLVNPSVSAETVKELVALVRANPGKYSYASAGAGTQSHLAGEAVSPVPWARPRPRPIQRRRPGDRLGDRRSYARGLQFADHNRAAHQGRQGARARCHRRKPLAEHA
jgi:hypothetical protein